jgi:hypothetical protein
MLLVFPAARAAGVGLLHNWQQRARRVGRIMTNRVGRQARFVICAQRVSLRASAEYPKSRLSRPTEVELDWHADQKTVLGSNCRRPVAAALGQLHGCGAERSGDEMLRFYALHANATRQCMLPDHACNPGSDDAGGASLASGAHDCTRHARPNAGHSIGSRCPAGGGRGITTFTSGALHASRLPADLAPD